MKNIIISADGDRLVYSVPDVVAENLAAYCEEFIDWLYSSPHAMKYRIGGGLCYNESDFIEYLDRWRFPDESFVLIANLGICDSWSGNPVPEKYRNCPQFNF